MIPFADILRTYPAYILAAGLLIICITLQYTGLADTLQFDRQSIDKGHWWLLLSGNFVHLGDGHLWMNMAGLALIVTLIWHRFSTLSWLLIITLSSVTVGVGLYFLNPEVGQYVGFSGTLHGLLLAGCIADLRFYPRSAGVLLFLIVGKLVWEQLDGALPGSESVAGGTVIVDAHLYGAIAGAVISLLYQVKYRTKDSRA